MIDVIVNETGGVTVAHDLKALDGYDQLDIGLSDGAAVLRGPAGEHALGTLLPAMLGMLRPDGLGRAIRVQGWSIARISPLTVRTHA